MSRLLGLSIEPTRLLIPEIQSLDLRAVTIAKTKAAYDLIQKPLIIDDVSFVIHAMGRLPGPFIKFFIEEMGEEKLCRLVDLFHSREATAEAMIGYHDGEEVYIFHGSVHGMIAHSPLGEKGFGWDKIFIPDDYSFTRGEMNEEDYDKTSPRVLALRKLKAFLQK